MSARPLSMSFDAARPGAGQPAVNGPRRRAGKRETMFTTTNLNRAGLLLLACLALAAPVAASPGSARAAAVTGTGYTAEPRANAGSSSASAASGGDIIDDAQAIKSKWVTLGGIVGVIMTGVFVFLAWGQWSVKRVALIGLFALIAAYSLGGSLWDTAGNTATDVHNSGSAAIGQGK